MPEDQDKANIAATIELTCGLVMPIAVCDGCSAEHWLEVRGIIDEAIRSIDAPRFAPRLVSEADDVGLIHKRIVQGLYDSDVVVCDVSGKNANVMFELGMRLAFDKPVVIVKDDKTDYSFDTGVIEHLTYPRDLRFGQIVAFKEILATKVKSTHTISQNPEHPTFLKSFGTFQVARLKKDVVGPERLILESIQELNAEVAALRRERGRIQNVNPHSLPSEDDYSKASEFVRLLPNEGLRFAVNSPGTFLKKHQSVLPDDFDQATLLSVLKTELNRRNGVYQVTNNGVRGQSKPR